MKDDEELDEERRSFLGVTVWLLGTGTALAIGIPGAMYVATPLVREGEAVWVDLGDVAAFASASAPVEVRFRYAARSGYVTGERPGRAYVLPDGGDGVKVLSAVCTHKACNVSWSKDESLFTCPCHSGRFTPRGEPAGGPPSRALDSLPMEVRDGHLFALVAEGSV